MGEVTASRTPCVFLYASIRRAGSENVPYLEYFLLRNFINLQLKKARSNFLFLRRRYFSKKLHVFRKDCLSERLKEKRLTSFDLLNHLRVKVAPTRRAHREAQTPPLCEFRLTVEFSLAINFIIAPVNSSVARLRISLSSGISMFARWS